MTSCMSSMRSNQLSYAPVLDYASKEAVFLILDIIVDLLVDFSIITYEACFVKHYWSFSLFLFATQKPMQDALVFVLKYSFQDIRE